MLYLAGKSGIFSPPRTNFLSHFYKSKRPAYHYICGKQRKQIVQAYRFTLHGQTLWLSPERCIYWEEQHALIVSDLHFGKIGHFRKSGIAVPQSVYKEDMQRLVNQLQFYKPEQLIVVGDLFHSTQNKELDFFKKWRNDFQQLQIHLVKGNHDILSKNWYNEANIIVSEQHLIVDRFCFIHDMSGACSTTDGIDYHISGHIHPCVVLRGLGKQSISLPCYFFSENYAVLPAFSKFTGGSPMENKTSDHVFAIIAANASRGQLAAVIKV